MSTYIYWFGVFSWFIRVNGENFKVFITYLSEDRGPCGAVCFAAVAVQLCLLPSAVGWLVGRSLLWSLLGNKCLKVRCGAQLACGTNCDKILLKGIHQ